MTMQKPIRVFEAGRVNAIVNDPSIYPYVKGPVVGPLDLSGVVANGQNIALVGEFGCVIFIIQDMGTYEAHTSILPEGRGKWAVEFVRGCLHHVFTRTLAVEIWTRCPQGNRGALALVHRINATFEMRVERGYVVDNREIPADIYAIRVQDWMRVSPDLEARGAWFHDRLEEEYERLGVTVPVHAEEAVHNRYVGAAVEMIMGGQVQKAAIFYNRFAQMAGYAPLRIISVDPVTIDIQDVVLIIRADNFWVASVAPPLMPLGAA